MREGHGTHQAAQGGTIQAGEVVMLGGAQVRRSPQTRQAKCRQHTAVVLTPVAAWPLSASHIPAACPACQRTHSHTGRKRAPHFEPDSEE